MTRFLRLFFAIGLMMVVGSQASAGVGTVFVIDMENHNLVQPTGFSTSPQQLMGNPAAPYLNSLMTPGNPNAAQSSWASQYFNVAAGIHPSEPNYIWQEGGSNFKVNGDPDPYGSGGKVFSGPNLSSLLQAKYGAKGWKSYQEGIELAANPNLGGVPVTSFSGTNPAYTNPYNGSHQFNFAPKHDGQLFFTGTNGGTLTSALLGSSNPEAQFYSPLTQLSADLSSNNLARYNLITPDQFNDMHTGLTGGFTYKGTHFTGDQAAIAQGDNFLSMIIPQIMASQAYQNNGAIVIWFDETEGGDTSSFTIPEIVLSPLAKGNAYQSTLPYTHSSDLKTLQDLFGLSAPGYLGDAGTPGTNDLSDLFVPGAIPTALPAPEPSSMALFALGAAALAGWRLRRKK